MSQRKYLRSVARHYMKKLGIEKMNKKRKDMQGFAMKSIFAENWKKYVREAHAK